MALHISHIPFHYATYVLVLNHIIAHVLFLVVCRYKAALSVHVCSIYWYIQTYSNGIKAGITWAGKNGKQQLCFGWKQRLSKPQVHCCAKMVSDVSLQSSDYLAMTESHVQARPTGFQHVQARPNTSKHVQRCVQTRPIMYEAIVFNFAI